MEELKKLIEHLKGIAGATDIAKDFESAVKSLEVETDTLKGEAAARKKLEGEVKKLTADLEAAAGGADERVAKLTKERDAAVELASKSSADLRQLRLTQKLGEKLGIADPTRQKRAVESFVRDYLPAEIDFDDKGELPGIEKALKTFREKEAFFFGESPHEGDRSGSGPGAARGAPRQGEDAPAAKVDRWVEKFGGKK